MKIRKIFQFTFWVAILMVCSCKETEIVVTQQLDDPELQLFVAGQLSQIFTTVSGDIDSNYESTTVLHASISASDVSGNISIQIILNDDDDTAFPFNGITPFNINGTLINASAVINENGNIISATSGSFAVSEFRALDLGIIGEDHMLISGTFNFSDGISNYSGTFSDIILDCMECEG
ncbi:MAG: hypothetical protein AAF502_02965 [Bacteroidota bacterium]